MNFSISLAENRFGYGINAGIDYAEQSHKQWVEQQLASQQITFNSSSLNVANVQLLLKSLAKQTNSKKTPNLRHYRRKFVPLRLSIQKRLLEQCLTMTLRFNGVY